MRATLVVKQGKKETTYIMYITINIVARITNLTSADAQQSTLYEENMLVTLS